MQAFFSELQHFSDIVTDEMNELKHKISSNTCGEVQFGEHCFDKIAALSQEVEQLSRSVDYPNHLNFSLGHLLSLCETILDENEIMIDEVEELYKEELGELDRSVVYNNTRAIDINSSSQSPLNRSKLVQFLSANRNQLNNHTTPLKRKELKSEATTPATIEKQTPVTNQKNKRRLEDDIQETPDQQPLRKKPKLMKTPTLETMGLSAASLKLIGSSMTEDTPSSAEYDDRPLVSSLPLFGQPRAQQHSTSVGILPVTEREIQTLPAYLSKQIHSLSAINSCVETLNLSDLREITDESMASMFPNMTSSNITNFLLILLKLGKFKGTKRGGNSSLVYTIK